MFVNNKRSSTAYGARRSIHKGVGILDPGPITNHLLLDENNNPLQNLVKGKHYRGVNKAVWKQFYETYGGGPVLRRSELSIYSDDFKESPFNDLEEVLNENFLKNNAKNYLEDEDAQLIISNEKNNRENASMGIFKRQRTLVNKKRVAEASAESNFRKSKANRLESLSNKNK